MTTVCVICQHREPALPMVCDPCRDRLAAELQELPAYLAAATDLTAAPDTGRMHRILGAHLGAANRLEGTAADPIASRLPSGPIGSPSRIRISGTRTAPLPISVDLLSLVGPGSSSVTDLYSDQVGDLPPHLWASQWVADWADQLGHPAPHGDLPELAAWLAARIHWACNNHSAIDEFAAELHTQRSILRAAAGDYPPRPQLCRGVACQHCDTRALWRIEGRVECGACGAIYEQAEYERWVAELARQVRKARSCTT